MKDNRYGIGALITVLRKGQPPLMRRVHTDGSYLSASDSRVHFGLDTTTEIQSITVQWPGGGKERWDNVPIKKYVTLRQNSGKTL